MITTRDYAILKQQVEDDNNRAAKAEGGFNEILKQLKAEFGVSSQAEIKALMDKLNKEADQTEAVFEQRYQEVMRLHQSNLERMKDE